MWEEQGRGRRVRVGVREGQGPQGVDEEELLWADRRDNNSHTCCDGV